MNVVPPHPRHVRRLSVVSALLAVSAIFGTASTAQADAASGTCAAGWHLGSYTRSFPAYNDYGELMWKITWRKRWCYNIATKRVGSVYAPKPSVAIYSYFAAAWTYNGIVDQDNRYTNVDARGVRHPSYPQWGHISWHTVKLNHCAVKFALCTSHYYKVGTVAYWDGSKKVILP